MFRLIYVLILFSFSSFSQKGMTGSKNFYIKAAPTYGFILEQRSTIGNLVKKYIPGIEIDFIKPTFGNKKWHLENNLPEVGLAFNFIDFSNPKQLGQCYALSPFIDIPLNKKPKKTRVIFRIAWGVSYLTKKFDIDMNPKNIAIGSNWNTYVQFKWFWHINLNEKIRLEPGLSFAHTSNGRSQVPNLGLNVISLNLSVTFKIIKESGNNILQDSTSIWPTKHELLVWDAIGFNETAPPGGPKYFANDVAINYYYNHRNTHKFGSGFDLSYETQNAYHLKNSGDPAKSWTDILQLGVKLCYAYNIGRISFPVEMGFYGISKPKEDGSIFHRIGIRYYCKNGLMLNFTLKSHWAVASHFEYGLGYRLGFKNKKRLLKT